jgi:pSer/pThr/pTyr-binding forkhead associated (FHA) protein
MAGADVYCNNCGHKNPLGANFCSSCGAPLEKELDDPTTITFQVDNPADSVDDEFTFDLDDIPPDGGLLVVLRGPIAGARLALSKDTTTAGRHPDSDLFLDDVTVSRRHAEFVRSDDGFLVRDVGSLNGTYLNRERVDEAPIANGDEIQIGRYKLAYYTSR